MAVKALLHYALEVPDQGAGEKFYTTFGLVGAPSGDDAVHLRPAPIARDFPPEDALYRWGPPVPDDFGLNRELEN